MNESLQTALKKLRLSGVTQSLDVRLQEAGGHGLNHAEFLELILQDELAVRADRLMGRRIMATADQGGGVPRSPDDRRLRLRVQPVD